MHLLLSFFVLASPTQLSTFCIKAPVPSPFLSIPSPIFKMHLLAWLRWSLLALLIVNNCDGTAPGLDPTVDDILTDLTPLTHFRAHGTGRFSPLDGHLTTTFDLNEVVYGLFTVRRLVLDFLSAARDTAKTMASHMTNHSASSPFGLKSAVPIAYEMVKRVNRSLDLNNDVRMV